MSYTMTGLVDEAQPFKLVKRDRYPTEPLAHCCTHDVKAASLFAK